MSTRSRRSVLSDHPESVNDAGQPAAQRQEQVDPEMLAETDLGEHCQRRDEDGDDDANEVHGDSIPVMRSL